MLSDFLESKNNPPSAFTEEGPSIVELQTQLGEGSCGSTLALMRIVILQLVI